MAVQVETGLARLAREGFAPLRGRAVAVLTHPAAILPDATHVVDALLAGGVDVRALMGPEHGVRGSAPEGYSETAATDPGTGLPVLDTYLLEAEPLAEQLGGLGVDTVLVDLQNVGSRFYTYESSLHDVIRAGALTGVRVMVADRPNPIGGVAVDGPVLEPGHASYVGRAPIALRHGLTMGELARLFAAAHGAPEPEVAPLSGWHRDMLFAETGLPWVPPSPNLPTPGSTLTYPGTCLFEGSDVSVGRGTTTPFELLGAPWMDASWAGDLRAAGDALPGAVFRVAYFAPVAGRYAQQLCAGVQLHVTDPRAYDPLRTAMYLLASAQRRWPERLGLLPSFELLAGTDRIREALLAGLEPDGIVELWQAEAAAFRASRESILMY
jgi:uncharacterized protein YbbC (DUF1343 family)